MLYSKEEILLEATQASDFQKIFTMSDLMLESFMDEMDYYEYVEDEEMMLEAAGKIGSTIASKASSLCEKIKEYIMKVVNHIKATKKRKQLEKLMSPEFKNVVRQLDDNYVLAEVPDVVELKKLIDASDKFINKFIASCEKELDKAKDRIGKDSSRKEKDAELKRFAMFTKSASDKYDEIDRKFTTVCKNKVKLTKDRIYKFVQAGIHSEDDLQEQVSRIDQLKKKMTSAVDTATARMQNIVKRGEDTAEAPSTFLGKLNATIGNIGASVQSFVNKHSAMVKVVVGVMITIGAAFGISKVVKNKDQMKEGIKKAGSSAKDKVINHESMVGAKMRKRRIDKFANNSDGGEGPVPTYNQVYNAVNKADYAMNQSKNERLKKEAEAEAAKKAKQYKRDAATPDFVRRAHASAKTKAGNALDAVVERGPKLTSDKKWTDAFRSFGTKK